MGYLRLHDYNLLIQASELLQLTTKDVTVYPQAEALAQEEMSSKLRQRYDVDSEFTPTTPWNYTAPYLAADLIEINFPAYDATKTYVFHSLVIQAGVGYINTVAITVAEAFNPAKWSILGNLYDLFYALTPFPDFNYKKYYRVGNKVFYKNKVYTCLQETIVPDHFSNLQFPSQSTIPYSNIFPDNDLYGLAAWGVGVDYSVPANTLPTNTTYWTKGDNRSQQAVNFMCKIALYHMTPRIAVNNVPVNRSKGYEEAMNWLMAVSHGDVNADLPELQPDQGNPVMWGGEVKRINQW